MLRLNLRNLDEFLHIYSPKHNIFEHPHQEIHHEGSYSLKLDHRDCFPRHAQVFECKAEVTVEPTLCHLVILL